MVKWNLSRAWHQSNGELSACLRVLDGHVVTAMPSVMAALADRVSEVHPGLIILSGETADDSLRDRLRAAFGCPITSIYTLAEIGIAALACPTTDGYHPNEDVIVELIDGEVIMTSMVNYAMPLIRYNTGDRGEWDEQLCGCGTKPVLKLIDTRSIRVLARTGGHTLTTLDLAKLFAHLDVRVADVTLRATGVLVRHTGPPLTQTVSTTVAAAIRGHLGPSVAVDFELSGTPPSEPATPPGAGVGASKPDPIAIASWAREQLSEISGLRAAALTGSVLSPQTFTRYSDIDLTILADDDGDPRWLGIARRMHNYLAGLRVNVSSPASLEHSPLVRARLLSEHHPIIGDLAEIPWPTSDELRAAARYWGNDAHAVLWTQATNPTPSTDPIRVARIAARYSLDALRYWFLTYGGTSTRASDVLRAATADAAAVAAVVRAALDVATERQPPEADETDVLFTMALSAVDWLRDVI